MTGLLSFIPFVGALTGFLVAAVVAIAQFWPNWTPILMVGGVFLIGQALEGYVLSPKLVGAKVGLHPVWMMFALLASVSISARVSTPANKRALSCRSNSVSAAASFAGLARFQSGLASLLTPTVSANSRAV